MQLTQKEGAVSASLWRVSNCGVAAFGFLLVWFCGHRGLFLQDQSMVFDGAWRLLQGQVPYRDSLYPFGPITFIIQALFFKVFGVDFTSMVLSAAVLNGLAAFLVVRTVCLLFPDRRVVAIFAGLATACWFQAPFGTLWFEQTAFFFGLVALFIALKGEQSAGPSSYWLQGLAGVLAALSVLSKQNAGVLFYPVLAGLVVIPHFRKPREAAVRLAAQLSGVGFGIACFCGWLWLYSDPHQFFHYSIDVSRSLASERAPQAPILFVSGLLSLSAYPLTIRWCTLFFGLVGLLALCAGVLRRPTDRESEAWGLAGWIIVACTLFQQLFIISTVNEPENGLPFLGLTGGLAMSLVCNLLWRQGMRFTIFAGGESVQFDLPRQSSRLLIVAASLLIWSAVMLQGVRASWKRYVQQFSSDSRFTETLTIDGLRRIKWADLSYQEALTFASHRSGPAPDIWLRRADLEAVNEWLAKNPGNFFVFGDSTMLYGLHRRVPPQPWLYFLDGHSYLDSDLPYVDEAVVSALAGKSIRTVVIEKISWAGGQDAKWLPHMPRLNAWINGNFSKEKEFGIFEVWVAKSKVLAGHLPTAAVSTTDQGLWP